MTTLIELTPTHPGGRPRRATDPTVIAFERAIEYVESLGEAPFSVADVFRACQNAPAVSQMIRFFLALNFIESATERGARPKLYRVRPHALPDSVAA